MCINDLASISLHLSQNGDEKKKESGTRTCVSPRPTTAVLLVLQRVRETPKHSKAVLQTSLQQMATGTRTLKSVEGARRGPAELATTEADKELGVFVALVDLKSGTEGLTDLKRSRKVQWHSGTGGAM